LYLWRENAARRRNVPRFKVLSDRDLVKLVKYRPTAISEIRQKNLLPKKLVERYGSAILEALEAGAQSPLPTRPKNHVHDRPTRRQYEKLKRWRKRRALERGVESDIIIPGYALWLIAQRPPKTLDELEAVSELGPWRLAEYGQEILTVLKGD
ncbi:MAG: HRDC domain-containing protein, partial [Anaerolineae bacterium]|nr:HRDC domain-containing protein [Anaerolineae bacterium]